MHDALWRPLLPHIQELPQSMITAKLIRQDNSFNAANRIQFKHDFAVAHKCRTYSSPDPQQPFR